MTILTVYLILTIPYMVIALIAGQYVEGEGKASECRWDAMWYAALWPVRMIKSFILMLIKQVKT